MTIKILKNPSQEDLNVFLRQNYVVRRACYVNGEYLYFLYTKKETKKDDQMSKKRDYKSLFVQGKTDEDVIKELNIQGHDKYAVKSSYRTYLNSKNQSNLVKTEANDTKNTENTEDIKAESTNNNTDILNILKPTAKEETKEEADIIKNRKEGIKAFKTQKDKATTQINNIINFVIRNKDLIPEEDKKELVKFIEKQLVKLNEYGIMSKE